MKSSLNLASYLKSFVVMPCIISALVLCFACGENPQERITLGTFNMEWFGDNTDDDRKIRSEADDMLIAEVLHDTDADILAVQEVENPEALKRLVGRFNTRYPMNKNAESPNHEYRFVLSKSGGKQNVGFLFRAPAELVSAREISRIAVEKGRTREGFLAEFRINGTTFFMMNVHLKSSSRADSTPELREKALTLRRLQAIEIRAFADSLLAESKEANFFVLGDLNDSPQRKTTMLDTLKSASNLAFLTSDVANCTFSALPAIDHILASPKALKRVLTGTLRTVNFKAMLPDALAERVSDHCPIVVQFSANP